MIFTWSSVRYCYVLMRSDWKATKLLTFSNVIVGAKHRESDRVGWTGVLLTGTWNSRLNVGPLMNNSILFPIFYLIQMWLRYSWFEYRACPFPFKLTLFPFKLTLFLSLYLMGGRLPVSFDIMLWWVLPRANIYKKSCVSILSEYLFALWIWSKTARGCWSICVFMRIRLISICFIVK